MSSYIVDDDTINAVLAFAGTPRARGRYTLEDAGYDVSGRGGLARLGADMFALNVEALRQRYGEGRAFCPGEPVPMYAYTAEANHNRFAALKSLRCWLYQCAEGDVPEHPLCRALDQVRDAWQTAIIDDLPQYVRAEGW
jgi:hypothetical protein